MIRPVALALPLTPVVAGAAVAAPTLPRVPRGLPKPFEITVDVTLTRTTTWDARRGSAGDVCGSYRKASGRQVVVVGMRSADGTANVVRSRLSRPCLLVQARGDRANVNVNRTWDVIQAPCTSPPPAPPREADDCGRRRSATPSVRLTWTTGTDAEVVSPVPDRLLIVGLPVPASLGAARCSTARTGWTRRSECPSRPGGCRSPGRPPPSRWTARCRVSSPPAPARSGRRSASRCSGTAAPDDACARAGLAPGTARRRATSARRPDAPRRTRGMLDPDQGGVGMRESRTEPPAGRPPMLAAPRESVIARCRAIATHGRRCRHAPVAGSELCARHLRVVIRAAQARSRAGSPGLG